MTKDIDALVERPRERAGPRKWFGGGDTSDGYWVDPDPLPYVLDALHIIRAALAGKTEAGT